jgi:proliferating cell nuclear antigen
MGWKMITLKKVDSWKKGIDAISSFINEGNFRFNDNGVSLKATDPSQVVLVNFLMQKNAFDKFDLEPSFVGLDINELNKIMSRALPNDKLLMKLSDNEMKLNLEGDISRSFSLPLLDVSEEEIKMPSQEFDASVEINARILKEALKDASLFGSSVVLRVKEGQLSIEARGSSGTLHSVAKQQAKNITIKSKGEVVSKYSLTFLQNIVKEAEADQKVLLQLKNDAPMRVSYKIGPAQIEFYLAHMIL